MQLPGEDRAFWFSSAEDLILSKLLFFREGHSDKHLRDIAGIISTIGDELDREYIEQWTERLDVSDLWRRVLDA